MRGKHLGELEELVLLAVLGLGRQAYGVGVQQANRAAHRPQRDDWCGLLGARSPGAQGVPALTRRVSWHGPRWPS